MTLMGVEGGEEAQVAICPAELGVPLLLLPLFSPLTFGILGLWGNRSLCGELSGYKAR